MPSFAIGAQAEGIGDWGTTRGPLPVATATARALHAGVLARDIDVARSERLRVDHGMLQSLEFIFGADLLWLGVAACGLARARPARLGVRVVSCDGLLAGASERDGIYDHNIAKLTVHNPHRHPLGGGIMFNGVP